MADPRPGPARALGSDQLRAENIVIPSLFTSVVSFGVALFAAGVGVLMVLFGLSLRWLVPKPGR